MDLPTWFTCLLTPCFHGLFLEVLLDDQKENEDDCDWRCEMKMGTEADEKTPSEPVEHVNGSAR